MRIRSGRFCPSVTLLMVTYGFPLCCSLPGPGGGGTRRRGLLFRRAACPELGRDVGPDRAQRRAGRRGRRPDGDGNGDGQVRRQGRLRDDIKDGKGTCKVSTKGDKPGSVKFIGAYSGGGGMKATESKPVSVRIQKAPKAE